MKGSLIVIHGTADGFVTGLSASHIHELIEKAVQLSHAAPPTAAGSKCQSHSQRRGAVAEHDAGRQYPSWSCFRVNAVHHIICPGHMDRIMGIFIAR